MSLLIDTAEEEARWDAAVRRPKAGDPDWSGIPLIPKESVDLVLDAIVRATPEESGRFLSRCGARHLL